MVTEVKIPIPPKLLFKFFFLLKLFEKSPQGKLKALPSRPGGPGSPVVPLGPGPATPDSPLNPGLPVSPSRPGSPVNMATGMA